MQKVDFLGNIATLLMRMSGGKKNRKHDNEKKLSMNKQRKSCRRITEERSPVE